MSMSGRSVSRLAWIAAASLIIGNGPSPSLLWADAPLIEDGDARIDSANRRFFAIPGPGQRSTLVFRREGKNGRVKLWEMKGWPYAGYLDEDGEYLATGDWDVHFLKRGYRGDEVIVSFYRRSSLIKAVRVVDILRHPKDLGAPSEDGYHWGTWTGFVARHRFAIDTAEGRRLIYDVTTGALVEILQNGRDGGADASH
jgi:hypothetical protein